MDLIKIGYGILLALALHAAQSDETGPGGASGVVRSPDGRPVAGAKVSAITECKGTAFSLVDQVTASSDGSFHFSALKGADCNAVRLFAEKPEDFWLKTGLNPFYKGENGTTPLVHLPSDGQPVHADITLGIRGGFVNLRVRDTGSGKFIWAEFRLEKIPQTNPVFGSMESSTGRDGSPYPLFEPAGEYQVSIQQYDCKGKNYFARNPPRQRLVVTEGERRTQEIDINVQLIAAAKTYSNPHGRACKL